MKKIFGSVIFILTVLNAPSQVKFQDISFKSALELSGITGKLIFLQYESTNCLQCNEVANKAFSDTKLGEQLNNNFVCIRISPNHTDRQKIAALFNKSENSFGSMFISSDGTLIHVFSQTSSIPKSYEDEFGKALTKAGEGIRISKLEKEYHSGNRNIGFLEFYMQTRKSLRLETDSLLDEYVTLLPEDSISSKRIIIFIVGMTPFIDSKAESYLKKAYEHLNKKKYPFQLPFIPEINNRIANKSLRKAITEKNEPYALKIALFAKYIYEKEPEKGQNAYDSKMLDFYLETKDTLNYLNLALKYYNNNYLNISIDSIGKLDSINMKNIAKSQPFVSERKGDSVVRRQIIKYSKISFKLTSELEGVARNIYQFTNNAEYLSTALSWAKKANDLSENYNAMNIYALLLAKTGNKTTAIIWQEKAIALKKKYGYDTKILEKELSEMK